MNSFGRIAGMAIAACAAGWLLLGTVSGATAAPAQAQAQPAKAGKAPAYSADELAAQQRARESQLGVAALHKGRKGENCATCHGPRITLTDNQVTENTECVACHGDYKQMAEESAKRLANKYINPHASHLGPEIACTVCHQGHQESKAYCTYCHTNFDMPMPGNVPAKR